MRSDARHDGKIDSTDKNAATEAQPWRFWINDDADEGDYAAKDGADTPGSGSPDFAKGYVGGLTDPRTISPSASTPKNPSPRSPPQARRATGSSTARVWS
jgi:hypothetical protein